MSHTRALHLCVRERWSLCHMRYTRASSTLSALSSGTSRLCWIYLDGRAAARNRRNLYNCKESKTIVLPSHPQNYMAAAFVEGALASGGVVVFSKTWCPFCKKVKGLLSSLPLTVEPQYLELDLLTGEVGEDAVQDELHSRTGARSVPRVSVGGTWVGGCDDTMAAHASGQLRQQLEDAGALAPQRCATPVLVA
jgi:glutaredoxin 3